MQKTSTVSVSFGTTYVRHRRTGKNFVEIFSHIPLVILTPNKVLKIKSTELSSKKKRGRRRSRRSVDEKEFD